MGRKHWEYNKIYTDASRMEDNRVGLSFIIPDVNIMKKLKNNSDNLAVYTVAFLVALNG